jgi:uncharacterized C2H2 Zn-finger protein
MKIIPLSGKYAIGNHANAFVDDEDFAELSQWRWKAKPNANHTHVYAVRNVRLKDGRYKMLRMHREIIGIPYDGSLDIDHRNRDTMDNRRNNLRLVTRSDNVKNTTMAIKLLRIEQMQRASKVSLTLRSFRKEQEKPSTCPVEFIPCGRCGNYFRKKKKTQRYCNKHHKYLESARRHRQRKRQARTMRVT